MTTIHITIKTDNPDSDAIVDLLNVLDDNSLDYEWTEEKA